MPCSLEVVFSSFPTEAIKTNWHFQKGQGLLPTSMVTSHHILRKGNDSFLGFVCLYVLVWFWFWMLVFSFFSGPKLWQSLDECGSRGSPAPSNSGLGMNRWEMETPDTGSNVIWYNDEPEQETMSGDCTDKSPEVESSEKAGWVLNSTKILSKSQPLTPAALQMRLKGVLPVSHSHSLDDPFNLAHSTTISAVFVHPPPPGYPKASCICYSFLFPKKFKAIIAKCYRQCSEPHHPYSTEIITQHYVKLVSSRVFKRTKK